MNEQEKLRLCIFKNDSIMMIMTKVYEFWNDTFSEAPFTVMTSPATHCYFLRLYYDL